MRPIILTRQLDAADPNGICLDQTTVGAGDLLINGALASGGIATLDQQRRVEFESVANLSALTFTVVGTDEQGHALSEDVAGPNAGVSSGVLDFKTVTQISVDGAVGTNVEVGTNAIGASQIVPLDQYISPFNVSLGVEVIGTVDVTAEFTFDDVFADGVGPFNWTAHVDLTNVIADADGTFISPVTACRLLTNSGDGTAILRILQAGLT